MAQPLLKPVLGSDDTDASSLDAIRDMMVRESEQRPKPAGDRHVFEGRPQDLSRPIALGLSHPEKAPLRRPGQYLEAGVSDEMSAGGHSEAPSDPSPPAGKLSGLRPSKLQMSANGLMRQSGMAVVGIIIASVLVFSPTLALGLLTAILGFCAASYLMLGYDAFWRRALRPVRWYVARHPDRAASVHHRIDRLAFRWDAVLDRFPERLVAGLYLPDVSDIAAVADEDESPIDLRMSELGQS